MSNDSYNENYVESLRIELVELVQDELTPLAMHYGYSEVPLETNIKWRPVVLLLGNYSSGKSTLINEFLGGDIQATGQAPTDDSFTVITSDGTSTEGEPKVTDERDGKVLLHDPEYPFENLKKHGQRFAAHFKLKKVDSPFLKNLALIDTPGMLDSISEKDRGYNYQEVIGDLAEIADLVLVIFDPHKAGTVREAHASLRDTLPTKTFEDRVMFVLNRVDECASLIDLLRVYGTLCWNLSQMTGRKDIPPIHLTYSPSVAEAHNNTKDHEYLNILGNQCDELRKSILQAPRHRLDHLASFVEYHSHNLCHFLEALISYAKARRRFRIKNFSSGLAISFLLATIASGSILWKDDFTDLTQTLPYIAGGVFGTAFLFVWMTMLSGYFISGFHRNQLRTVDDLTPLKNQTRRDSWGVVRDLVYQYLRKKNGKYSLGLIKQEYASVNRVYKKGSKEIRLAMKEITNR